MPVDHNGSEDRGDTLSCSISVERRLTHLETVTISQEKALNRLLEGMTSLQEEIRTNREEMKETLHEIKQELSVYQTVIKTVRLVAGVVVLVATLKFGDIASFWRGG